MTRTRQFNFDVAMKGFYKYSQGDLAAKVLSLKCFVLYGVRMSVVLYHCSPIFTINKRICELADLQKLNIIMHLFYISSLNIEDIVASWCLTACMLDSIFTAYNS